MSFVSLDDVKDALVSQEIDDARLQLAIDDAEDEALQFLGMTGTSLEDVLVNSESDSGNYRSIRRAVILLVSIYIDPVKAGDVKTIRDAAERLLWPYREGLGV